MRNVMLPKYQDILCGKSLESCEERVKAKEQFFTSLEQLFNAVSENPEEAKGFFKASVRTKTCNCGEVVVISLAKAVPFADLKMTSEAMRRYIQSNGIGCRGKTMRAGNTSATCVHVKHSSLPPSLLQIIKPTSVLLDNPPEFAKNDGSSIQKENEADTANNPSQGNDLPQDNLPPGNNRPPKENDLQGNDPLKIIDDPKGNDINTGI
ncbi:Hypothetical predicted protein [Paramuricea clavata]|uniref:Uncharacterized protein n=1 Tax=Paramuricea clavata TaxID=317549 RepID=A0A7D9IU53_PARCT|nr:Hypothetical predicted protein [Paramuricea clavata]